MIGTESTWADSVRTGGLKFLDAVIAATTLVHAMTIVTRNIADFAATGVPVLNPWE
jgi:predicted nucleic acid-binding protein